jgi:type IV secretion system protein VirB8
MTDYDTLHKQLESGDYFIHARKWYYDKYLEIVQQRSILIIANIVLLVILCSLCFCVYNVLPLVVKTSYIVGGEASAENYLRITKANHINADNNLSLSDILLRNYVIRREMYNYANLQSQFNFLKQNSTRIVFRRFYNAINIDNPDSSILKYQKDFTRTVEIVDVKYIAPGKIDVYFKTSLYKVQSDEKLEEQLWQTSVSYEMDKIDDRKKIDNSNLNFLVTDYQPKLLNKVK